MGSVLYTGMGHECIMLCNALCSSKEELEGHLPHTNSPLAATMSYERCRRGANLGTKSTVLGLEPTTIRVTPRWLTHRGRTTVLAYGNVARALGLSKSRQPRGPWRKPRAELAACWAGRAARALREASATRARLSAAAKSAGRVAELWSTRWKFSTSATQSESFDP